jgi:acyl-CoA thioester hydrolase
MTSFVHRLTVAADAIDANGHVNNVQFIQWMQDAAVAHADAAGCTAATQAAGATWVVHTHRIEYRRPAYLGDVIEVKTWVDDFRRIASLRKYEFHRPADGAVLAKGETDWVFVDAAGRPLRIPPHIQSLFQPPAV